VIKGSRHDSPLLNRLLKTIPKAKGDLLADSRYLSRANRSLVAGKGRKPFTRPRKNSKRGLRGSGAWWEMVTLYQEDREAFMGRYHGRSKAESLWSVLKRVYGNSLFLTRTGCRGGGSRTSSFLAPATLTTVSSGAMALSLLPLRRRTAAPWNHLLTASWLKPHASPSSERTAPTLRS